ncbi:hypothetical protein [Pandoraea communis]|uniref:hypothetical protein n=1 Tax=Pandoraea communis TaxID=2508297 RepID=UPI00158447A4|nr:hypothetical protein [Pandoraea communis]
MNIDLSVISRHDDGATPTASNDAHKSLAGMKKARMEEAREKREAAAKTGQV